MKLLNKLLIIIIFILISNSIKAQFIPNTTFINTPYGNIPITTYYHMPIAYFNLEKKPTSINTKDYYTIKLKNDSTIKVYGEIDFSDSVNTFIIKEKRKIVRKIYPNETKYIIALGEKNLRVAGNPKDSCWVFQQTKDSVSLYSVVAEANEDYALFFSKNNGIELLVLNETNLLALVGDDEKLIKIIKKDKNYIKAIKKYNLKLKQKNE